MNDTSKTPKRATTIIVVPCYNEARRLDAAAFDSFLDCNADTTLIFVDDGSTDDTPLVMEQIRQQHAKQICTLRLSANVGKAEAVRRGIQAAFRRRPDFVGFWDADLATPLDAIPQFRDVLRRRPELQLVMGSRVALLGRQIRRSGSRHLLGRIFATCASIVLRLPVYDTQCGAKLFRVSPETTALFAQPFGTRWVFDVEILARLVVNSTSKLAEMSLGERIFEFPLDRWHDVAASRLRHKDFAIAALDLAAIYWRYMRRGAQPQFAMPKTIQQPAPRIQHRDAA